MPFIAENYHNHYAFTVLTETLGPIRVWKIEGKFLILEVRINFVTRNHIQGYPFIKVLVSKYATHLNLENERKRGEPITAEEAEKLLPEEAEQIAEEVIRHHEYLFKDRNKPTFEQHPPNEQGEELVEVSEQKLDIPRNKGEKASDYLYRLVLALSEREEIGMKTTAKNISELVKKMSDLPTNFADSFKSPIYNFTPPVNPQHTTNAILRDLLNDFAAQKELNEQLVMTIKNNALESKKDSLESTRRGIFSNRVAVAALIVAILTAIFTVVFEYLSYKGPSNNQSPPPVSAPESPQGEVQ